MTALLSDRYGYWAVKDGEDDPYGNDALYEERGLTFRHRVDWTPAPGGPTPGPPPGHGRRCNAPPPSDELKGLRGGWNSWKGQGSLGRDRGLLEGTGGLLCWEGSGYNLRPRYSSGGYHEPAPERRVAAHAA